jgi:branched-chain amino acid transport system permease protein
MSRRPYLQFVLLAAAVAGLQLTVSAAGKSFYLTQLTMSVYYGIVVLGLSLLMGFAGQVSLGHGAFFALGGYASAFLTTHDFASVRAASWGQAAQALGVFVSRTALYDSTELLSVAPWAAFLVAMGLTLVVAALIGYPSLRLKGHYLAMATLGFGLIIYRILLGAPDLGSADGITGVPSWSLGGGLVLSGQSRLRVQNYYFAWGVALLVLLLLTQLVHSRMGRALRAIHDGELAANVTGVDTARLKLQTFVVSAVLAAAAGSFMAHYNQGIGPSEASALKSVRYVALVAAGGMANLTGALVVSTLLNFVSLRGWFGTYDNAVFGLILILIVALAPQGPFEPLGRGIRRLARFRWGRRERTHAAA